MWPSDGMRPKSVVWATSMTPQSFYHAKPGSLSHRWVVAEERSRIENDDKAEATRALRKMRAGRLSKMMKVGGEIFTCMIEQDRSPLWRARLRLECSRKTPAVASCFQLTNGDHKPKRSAEAGAACQQQGSDGPRVLHQTVQRLLERREIAIPFDDTA